MSHYSVLCILGTVAPSEADARIAAMLAPFDENDEHVTNAKWDWYELGGRWTGLLTSKDGAGSADVARIGDVQTDGLADRIFAMLTPEGWEAPAAMGWFGAEHNRTEDDASWRERVASTLAALDPRTLIAVVDCHI